MLTKALDSLALPSEAWRHEILSTRNSALKWQ